jgi:hypothetical protein
MSKPAAFIMVEGGRTWLRASAETEEAIRTGFIMESIPLYTAPAARKHLTGIEISQGFKADDDATHPYSYWAGVNFAEKHHGIGGGDHFAGIAMQGILTTLSKTVNPDSVAQMSYNMADAMIAGREKK